MATKIRTEISTKKDHYISKHRYLELVHFCLQYPEWLSEYHNLGLELRGISYEVEKVDHSDISDHTANIAILRERLYKKIYILVDVAKETSLDNWEWLLESVTKEKTWEVLVANGMDISKHKFYELRRQFFYNLSQNLQVL